MDEATEQRLLRMLDEHEIERLIRRWGHALDRGDRAELAALYHPDGVEHHGTFDGPSSDYVDYVIETALPRYACTTHYVTNCLVEVDGDRASAETYVLAAHLSKDDSGERLDLMNARLIDHLERREGQWRISERTVVHDWDKSETIEAVERWRGVFEAGQRGPGDFSYSIRAAHLAD